MAVSNVELRVDSRQAVNALRQAQQGAQSTSQAVDKLNAATTATNDKFKIAANGIKYFTDAAGRARAENGRFLTTAERAAAGIKPVGLGARDTLRLEKGYCLYGNDIDDYSTPLEAGLGWITKFTKEFTSSTFLKKQKETGVEKKLVGFEMVDRGIPRHDYMIRDEEGNLIGRVTSGTQSPTLNKGIGMGYVLSEFAPVGSEIFVDIRDKQIKAVVVQLPFVK